MQGGVGGRWVGQMPCREGSAGTTDNEQRGTAEPQNKTGGLVFNRAPALLLLLRKTKGLGACSSFVLPPA
jgi:hypothetical protein